MIKRPSFLCAVLPLLSGVALCLSFPNFSFFFLAWIGLVPYLHFVLQKPSWPWLFLGHLVMTTVYLGGIIYWIPEVLVLHGNLNWPAALGSYLLLLVVLSLFLAPFSLLVRVLAQRSLAGALLCAPGFWVLTELCRNYYPDGFPWALLGYSQYPYGWIIQIADLGGVYLVSLLVVAANCSLLAALRLRSLRPLFLFAFIFLGVNLYGFYCYSIWLEDSQPTIQTVLVQPNIKLSGSNEYYAEKYFEDLPKHYREAVEKGAEWVIFPEAPNPFFYRRDFYFTSFWERQVAELGTYLLFNTTSIEQDSSVRYFNSAVLLGPEGSQTYRYDKQRLVPFGEYVPMEDWLGLIFDPVVQEVSQYSAGRSSQIGSLSQIPFGTLICYEAIFPELSRHLVREGAQVLVNITNDSWYGRSAAARQHLEMSAFRAIESRRPLLRCANSGYSAVIDPLGRVTQQLGLFEEGILEAAISGISDRSIYSRTGEWLNIVIVIVTAFLAVGIWFRNSESGNVKSGK